MSTYELILVVIGAITVSSWFMKLVDKLEGNR